MNFNFDSLEHELSAFGLSLTEQMKDQFSLYYQLLITWNKSMNLTSITEFSEVVEKHFLDSVILGAYMDLKKDMSLIDIGTGAGFPGVPLKIVFPKLNIVLADSLKKRLHFLEEVISSLELKDMKIVHGRAEDLARESQYREQFDLCVSRAVANLTSLSEYCLPFVKTGGYFVSYKSGDTEEEVQNAQKAIQLLGGELEREEKFQLITYKRSLLFLKKLHPTDKKYPRKAGTPTKQPLS